MKKAITVAARQSRNFSRQTLTIGLDLGDRNSYYCGMKWASWCRSKITTTAKALQAAFGAMPRSRIALEIGTHSPWISRLLRELGDPELLCPVKHRSAQAQADLTMIRARAALVRARTGLVNSARSLAKSYGERLRGCNVRNMNPEKAESLSPKLQVALEPLLHAIESRRISGISNR